MSEITKLYKNAGIDYEERYNNCTLNKEGECELKCSCDICKYSEEKYIYPPFTAEKQIELIKWLALTRPVHINKFIDGWTIEGLVRNNKQYNNFENAISGYINSIYPFLDEHQRTEIKEILE